MYNFWLLAVVFSCIHYNIHALGSYDSDVGDDDYYDYSYDENGFNWQGFDSDGYDKQGFTADGYDQFGFGRDGFDINGYDRSGFNRQGFDSDGTELAPYAFGQDGLDSHGCDENGFDKNGFDRYGFDANGYNQYGFDHRGYDKDGIDRFGFNRQGFDSDGFDYDGYDRYGFDKEGFDRDGFDCHGYDRLGFNQHGLNEHGFDQEGFHLDGYDVAGYTRDGLDEHGFDRQGFNSFGYDTEGFDREGFSKNGISRDVQEFDSKADGARRSSRKKKYKNQGAPVINLFALQKSAAETECSRRQKKHERILNRFIHASNKQLYKDPQTLVLITTLNDAIDLVQEKGIQPQSPDVIDGKWMHNHIKQAPNSTAHVDMSKPGQRKDLIKHQRNLDRTHISTIPKSAPSSAEQNYVHAPRPVGQFFHPTTPTHEPSWQYIPTSSTWTH